MKPDAVAGVAVRDLNHAAELKCQGRALTFPGNPTSCPQSAGEQRTQKGAGQGELCHRDEGWGEGQREGGWCQVDTTERVVREMEKRFNRIQESLKKEVQDQVINGRALKREQVGMKQKREQDRKKWAYMSKNNKNT